MGAWRTKRKQPWKMVLLVTGFTTQRSALGFEWHWTYSDRSTILRDLHTKLPGAKKKLRAKVRLVYEMLNKDPWRRLPLQLVWLDMTYGSYTGDCPSIPKQMRLHETSLEDLVFSEGEDSDEAEGEGMEGRQEEEDEVEEERLADLKRKRASLGKNGEFNDFSITGDSFNNPSNDNGLVGAPSTTTVWIDTENEREEKEDEDTRDEVGKSNFNDTECSLCHQLLVEDSGKVATCTQPSCTMAAHLICLAAHFVHYETPYASAKAGESLQKLIPTRGHCPLCYRGMQWIEVVRAVRKRYSLPDTSKKKKRRKRKNDGVA